MRRLKRITIWVASIFWVSDMTLVVYLSLNKVVVIAENGNAYAQNGTLESAETEAGEKKEFSSVSNYAEWEAVSKPLPVQMGKYEDTSALLFSVPLETQMSSENVNIENHYLNRVLVLNFSGATEAYYQMATVLTNHADLIEKAEYASTTNGVLVHVHLNQIYEYKSTCEQGYLNVELIRPYEMYEKIIVIDTDIAKLNETEFEYLSDITQQTMEQLSAEGIKAYYIPPKQVETPEDSLSAAEVLDMVEAQLYLGLDFAEDENSAVFGTLTKYNSHYFLPDMTSGTYANIMEQQVAVAIKGNALGLTESEYEEFQDITVPAAIVYVGHETNNKEWSLFAQPSYRKKVADGLFNGIVETYQYKEGK